MESIGIFGTLFLQIDPRIYQNLVLSEFLLFEMSILTGLLEIVLITIISSRIHKNIKTNIRLSGKIRKISFCIFCGSF